MFRNIVILVVAILIVMFVFPATVLAEESNYSKAENFTKIGRYSEAISALEAQIQLKSDDAKAYLMLGNIHLQLNDFAGADKEFQAAITFNPSYRAEIGKKFYAAGLASLNSGEIDQAKYLFERTIKQDPAQAKNIAVACLQASKKYFGISQPEKAEKLLPLVLLDKSLTAQIQAQRTKYGEKILAEAKKELSEEKRQVAIKYLGQEKVDAEFPPKQWVVVFEKPFTGEGYGKGDDGSMIIAYVGKDLLFEDRITITGEEFEVWYAGVWNKHYKERQVINKYSGSTGSYDLKVPEGVVFKVKIERFMYPSEKEKLANLSLNQ